MKGFCCRSLVVTLLALIFIGSLMGIVNAEERAFTEGEKLFYRVYFAGVSAGTQVIQVKEKFNYQGQPVYRIKTDTQSSGLAKLLYKYDEDGEILIDAKDFYPLYSRRQVLDKGKDYTEETYFQVGRKQAIWERLYKDGRRKQENFPMAKPAQDGMSIMFYLRSRPWETEEKEFFLVTNHGIKGYRYIIKDEPNFKSALGVFDTTRVSYTEQRDDEEHKYTIWFTKDRRTLPLKILVDKKVIMDLRLIRVENTNGQ